MMAELGGEDLPANHEGMHHHSSDESVDSCSDDQPLDEYNFTDSSHSSQVLSGLKALREEGCFCDVSICVDDQEFLCHRIVLASFSPYFKAMFASDMAESRQSKISINGVEAPMIRMLIDYAYTSEVLITKSNVQSLLSASNLLEILPVRDACCSFLERNMDITNALGIHCFAEVHACTELQEKAKKFALQFFPVVCLQEEFEKLGQAKLVELIRDDDLYIESEEEVFNSVVRWLDHDPDTRSLNFQDVLEHVRLPLLSPYFLFDCVALHPVIRDSAKCSELVDEAKTYCLLMDRRAELQSPRTRPRQASGTQEVIVAVGGEDDKVVLRSVEFFNPFTHCWKTLACLPFAISKHGLVVTGSNHLYMAGGEFPDGSASKCMWRYDPCFDSWQEMASMNMSRSELGLATLDGYIYAVGGWEGAQRLDSVERYNPLTNSWSFAATLKMAVTSPAVVAHNGLLYVTGGAVLEDGDGIDLVQVYHPRTNQFTEVARMLIPRSGSAACVLNGYLYVIGGWHASTENTNKVERYHADSDTWEQCAPMKERRYRPGVAVVDGKIYVCGGEEGWDRYHDTIEAYDDKKDTWEIVDEMPTSRSWLSCVAMTINKDFRCSSFKRSSSAHSCIV